MIPKLQDNPMFLNEYKTFQNRITAVTDEKLQKELTKYLVDLRNTIVYLDRQHESLYLSNRMPSDVGETRSQISDIRKNLETKLSAWERRQLPR
jgi:hypothetical protein